MMRLARSASLATCVPCALVASSTGAAAQEPIVRASLTAANQEADGHSFVARFGAVSADGRFVVFVSSATNLVSGDTNGFPDVFVRDLLLATTVRVSVSSSGEQGDDSADELPGLSEDGRFVVFGALAGDLVAGDTNQAHDVFVHDRDPDGDGTFDEGNGTTERVSVASDGSEGNGSSTRGSISADGDEIAFLSGASNLIPLDKNGVNDVFVHVRSTGVTERASRNDAGVGADDQCEQPQISADGGAVVFMSLATNLGGPNGPQWDIFVRDLVNDVTDHVSEDEDGGGATQSCDSPSISGDGRYVVFRSQHRFTPEDDPSGTSYDVFRKDRVTGAVDCMTADSRGLGGNGAQTCSISADGTKVAFHSEAGIWVPVDTNQESDFLVRDVATGAIACVNINCVGIPAEGDSDFYCSLSRDGRFAVFGSYSTELVHGDTNGLLDVFVNDLANPGFQATWSNYGAGWPGTKGTPTLTSSADPEFGAAFDLAASNSWGQYSVGFVLLGFAEASIPTSLDGTILVAFDQLIPVIVSPSGWRQKATIPYDTVLCGMEAHLQMLQVDPGASKGVSFTPRLKLVFGR